MSATTPRRGSIEEKIGAIAVWSLIGLLLLLGLVTNLAERIAGPPDLPGRLSGWFAVTLGALHAPGAAPLPWTAGCWLVTAGVLLLLIAPLAAAAVWRFRRRPPRLAVDAASQHLATRADLAPLTRAGATARATELGAPTDPPGLIIGEAI